MGNITNALAGTQKCRQEKGGHLMQTKQVKGESPELGTGVE